MFVLSPDAREYIHRKAKEVTVWLESTYAGGG